MVTLVTEVKELQDRCWSKWSDSGEQWTGVGQVTSPGGQWTGGH